MITTMSGAPRSAVHQVVYPGTAGDRGWLSRRVMVVRSKEDGERGDWMRPTVLIVEDDPFILEMLLDAIEVAGCQASGVGRASQVESMAAKTTPDLFLIDIMLPEFSGIELAQHLRATG